MIIFMKLLITAFFWGGTFVAGRILAGHIGPFSAAFLRFVVASGVLLLIMRNVEGKFPRIRPRQIFSVILLGLTGIFLYNVCFFYGLKIIPAGRAALIIATNPIAISLFSALLFQEKLTPLKIIGILLSTTGAVIVISKGNLSTVFSHGLGWGEVFIFGCVLSWTAFSLIGKTVITHLSPLVTITYASVAGMACLFIPALTEGMIHSIPSFTVLDWFCIVYLGLFGTAVGFVWYYQGIKQVGPITAGQFINFVPVSAVLLAFLILDEPVTLSLLIGAGFIISGVYLMNAAVSLRNFRNRM
ncbi:MAG: EamA family transporter [Desulfobacteraceae bacterium]|nr:MAG: EamA family transporter [Desulfobacteraceae bacterium]